MRPTGLARKITAVAGGLYLAGALSLTIGPPALATVLLVYLAFTRWSAARSFERVRIQVARSVVEPVVHEGRPFHVELDATGSRLPQGVKATIRDQVPGALEPAGGSELVGPTRRRYRARALERGSVNWTQVRAEMVDARALWSSTRTVRAPTELRVLPPREALEAGHRLARREPLEATTPDKLGLLVRELEFESFREFTGGDRLRDVDWKRFAKLGKLLTKEWEREGEASVLLLVDAGRTMRAQHGEVTKLDHAATLSLELARAAIERGYPVGYVAFDEVAVVDRLRPTHDRALPDRLAEHLSRLPGHVLARRRLDVGLPEEAPADENELDFLAVLAELREGPNGSPGRGSRGGRRAGPFEGGQRARASQAGQSGQAARGALGAREVGRGPSRAPGLGRTLSGIVQRAGRERLFVVLFTDLEAVPDRTLELISQLTQRDHQVTTVVLPGTRFLAPPERIRARDLENAYRELQTRRRAHRLLAARGVPVVELGPEGTAASIVRASNETSGRGGGRRGGGTRRGGSRGDHRGGSRGAGGAGGDPP